jgi:hypothetical protein
MAARVVEQLPSKCEALSSTPRTKKEGKERETEGEKGMGGEETGGEGRGREGKGKKRKHFSHCLWDCGLNSGHPHIF